MANPNWKKGVSGNPLGKPVGIKNRDTIEKEERRVIFDEEVSKVFIQKIAEARAEYLLDQFMGPVTQKTEHSGLIHTEDLTSEVIAEVKERKKQKLANAKS